MKPWEETWRINPDYPNDVFGAEGGDVILEGVACTDEDHSNGRTKLAAAAPEMARALLALYMGQEVSIGVIREALRTAGVILSFEEEAALLERGETPPRGPRP